MDLMDTSKSFRGFKIFNVAGFDIIVEVKDGF